jgi:catechol 2,3-dioxygenase-like lactoylglutathione lyase family enzyme
MIKGIDHIVILVSDLDKAVEEWSDMGFTVVPGGEHTGGLSHNALISLADGSYLELVAFRGPVPKDHFFYREGVTEGLITYALLPSDLEADIAAIRERGLEYAGPRSGGRLRPDGVRIEWQIGTPPSRDLPFLCADVTPRELRVPGGDACVHRNGVIGISMLTISVADLDASVDRYARLLGDNGSIWSSTARAGFDIGNSGIVLIQDNEPIKRHEGPTSLSLSRKSGSPVHLNFGQSR